MILPVKPGEILDGKYAAEEVIGEGGMGFVLAARHIELDTPVAIKVLRPHASPDARTRFLREARAASQIESEHVARVFDVGRLDDGTPFMIMELLEGRDLDDVLYDDGPLPIARAVDYALQACQALAAAHRRGVVHRDVKPANLFVTTGDKGLPCLKLLDFGISKVPPRPGDERGSLTRTGSFVGSPQFMSPEQMASCRQVDGRSDLWSLGVCLFELLTGEPAFEGQTVAELYSAILRDEPRRIRDYRPEVPAGLDWVVQCCLEKDTGRRVQSAEELADMLQPFGSDADSPEITVTSCSHEAVLDPWPEDSSETAAFEPRHDSSPPSARPSRPPAWTATEVIERAPSLPPVEEEEPSSSPGRQLARGGATEEPWDAAESLAETDQTPAGAVLSVAPPPVKLSSDGSAARRPFAPWSVTGALVAAGLIAGGLGGAAVSAESPAPPAAPQPAVAAPAIRPAPVLVLSSPAPAPTTSGASEPLVYSTELSKAQRTMLLQQLEAAERDLELGEHDHVMDRVDRIVQELADLGVEPHKANSSMGAKAQLMVGRVVAAEARGLLVMERRDIDEARAWSKRVEVKVARARVAFERVNTWGVRSFYRCGLVEMAALDRAVGRVFVAAATSSPSRERNWYLAQARRHYKHARVGLRHAARVRSETMLCVEEAQEELAQVTDELSRLDD